MPETASLFFGEACPPPVDRTGAGQRASRRRRAAKDYRSPCPMPRQRWKKRRAICACSSVEAGRRALSTLRCETVHAFTACADDVAVTSLTALTALLESQAERSRRLAKLLERADANCWQRAGALAEQTTTANGCAGWRYSAQALHLNATPLSIAEIFQRQIDGHPRAWIFTSATLSVKGDFRHYQREMGLERPPPHAGKARSITRTRRCFTFPRTCRSRIPGLYARRGGCGAAGDRGRPRAARFSCLPVCAPCARRANADGSRHCSELGWIYPLLMQGEGSRIGVAGALSQTGQCGAARKPVLLGRRGRARRGVVAGDYRSSAIFSAGRSGTGGTHRKNQCRRRAMRSWITSCRRR